VAGLSYSGLLVSLLGNKKKSFPSAVTLLWIRCGVFDFLLNIFYFRNQLKTPCIAQIVNNNNYIKQDVEK